MSVADMAGAASPALADPARHAAFPRPAIVPDMSTGAILTSIRRPPGTTCPSSICVLQWIDFEGLRPVLAELLGWTSARGYRPFDPVSIFLLLGWQLYKPLTRAQDSA